MLRLLTKAQVNATSWLREKEEGASAVEYGLLIGLIAIAIIAVVGLLGDQLSSLFGRVKDAIAGV
jgi:pilus assembly protein Flp/PilA